MRTIRDEIEELQNIEKAFKILLEDHRYFIVEIKDGRLEFTPRFIISKNDELNNCQRLGEFLLPKLRTIAWNQLKEVDFETFRQVIDNCYLYVKRVREKYGLEEDIRAWTLSLKLGGKIPVSYLLSQESKPYISFLLTNFLHHWLFAFRLQVPYNTQDGPALPIKGLGWVLWKELKEHHKEDFIEFWWGQKLLFVTGKDYTLHPDYSCLYEGIQKFNSRTDPHFIPFDRRNPAEWGHKHILEVWTVCQSVPKEKPSMFLNTHAFFVLRDDKGFLRSAGQDVIVDLYKSKKTELLSHKPGFGKITTPDAYVSFPKNSRRFWKATLEITKEQHNKIVAIVEADKENSDHSISVMKKNCSSYILKILKEGIGLTLDADMHGFHIFAKALLPDKWYRKWVRRWERWYMQQSECTKKLLFFFPLFYLPCALLAFIGALTNQNSFQNRTDFHLGDFLLRPWKMTVDHPLALHRNLERHLKK